MAEHTDPHGQHGHGHDPDVNPAVSHETRDVNVFQISAFGIGLLLAGFAAYGLSKRWRLFGDNDGACSNLRTG